MCVLANAMQRARAFLLPACCLVPCACSSAGTLTMCVRAVTPRTQVLDLVVRQPALLMLGPDTLRSKIGALQRLLGGADYQIAVMLLAKQPSLAGFSEEVLTAKHAALCDAAGLAPAKVRGGGRIVCLGRSRARASGCL